MANGRTHPEVVAAWLARHEGEPPRQLLERFAKTWDAVWRRAELTLGDITARSASRRVLATAAEKFPALAPLRVDDWETSFEGLEKKADGTLREALSFLMTEALSLLGHLSGGILTPPLHAQLAGVPAEGHASRVTAGAAAEASTSAEAAIRRLPTGVPNLDALLGGGLPEGSLTVLAGAPGSGKTTMGHQIAFHLASPDRRVLYISTFSEPAAKLMRFMRQFDYFDPAKIDESLHLLDIGKFLRGQDLDRHLEEILSEVERLRPALLVIDSFKGFEGLARSERQFRRFSYDLAASLLAWDCTSLLIGEYVFDELSSSPLFSVADGLIMLSHYDESGEHQRFIQVLKMRGADQDPDRHPFAITAAGVGVYATPVSRPRASQKRRERLKLNVSRLDDLLDGGILRGSSVLVSGVSGTGKTVLMLETLYRGALAGQKGLLFSFEETAERLIETAQSLGWDFAAQVKAGRIELVYIPHPDIRVERHMVMIAERIRAFKPARVAVDSLSVFLHKVGDPALAREKTFQLAAAVGEAGAVGFFSADIPYGTPAISRKGVEETVLDGTIILSANEDGLERRRYAEVYKMRATPHLMGRHPMLIGSGGLRVFPRASFDARFQTPPAPRLGRRLGSGVPGLDEMLGGGLFESSSTLLSGGTGSGKSTFALQFLQEGAANGEKGLYVTLEEGPGQILATADALGVPLRASVERKLVELMYFPPERIVAGQYLTVLTEKIQDEGIRRLVFDGANRLSTGGLGREQAQTLLHNLVVRFKALGATSLLTLETSRRHSEDLSAEGGLSAVADNLILLRYSPGEERTPLVTVVKTRASAHASESHTYAIGSGGARVGPTLHPLGAAELSLP